MFKYSAYKNLASLAENDGDEDKAVDLYLEVFVQHCWLGLYIFNANSMPKDCLKDILTVDPETTWCL